MGDSVVKSVRASAEFWAGAEAAAKASGEKLNAWAVRVMAEASGSGGAGARPPADKPAPAPRQQVAKVAKAVEAAEVRQAAEAGPVFGYQRPVPGARLKRQGR